MSELSAGPQGSDGHYIVELREALPPGGAWVVCSCGERFNYFGSYECDRWMETHGERG